MQKGHAAAADELRRQLRVYLVMSLDGYAGRSAVEIARAAIEGGATMIQLREKDKPLRDVLPEGRQLRELCRRMSIPFIVNDRVDVALLLDADGVHVGQDDLPGVEVRKLIGPDRIVGISAGDAEEARWALEQGADYLGVGPVYSTATKLDAGEAIGLALIEELAQTSGIPMVGIGGIHAGNVAGVVTAGADGAAVVSAITRTADPAGAAAGLRTLVDQASRERTAGR
ncbi:MAG: thiamine-phosphate pyrophosphorylase [Paenibacillaceae bacterium]|jgi:thiamine-phosphate pyrophosphorylase|nr:thiamine-phosphate pyrophosphorylase [Paenibacillaceae bacterium]